MKKLDELTTILANSTGIEKALVQEVLSEYRSLMLLKVLRCNDKDNIDIDLPFIGVLHTNYKGSKDTPEGIKAVLDATVDFDDDFLIDFDNAKNEDPILEKQAANDLNSVIDIVLGKK